jgi:opacity protein-like surface antigen
MRKLLLAGAGVIALLGGSSNAADLAPVYALPAPPLVAVFNWTGCYVGGNAGGIWANSDWGDTILGDFGSNTPSACWAVCRPAAIIRLVAQIITPAA